MNAKNTAVLFLVAGLLFGSAVTGAWLTAQGELNHPAGGLAGGNAGTLDACVPQCAQLILSPGSTDALVSAMDGAQRSIDVGLYEFSAAPLKAALKRAHDRGVRVRVLLDPSVSQNQVAAEFLALEGMDVKWSPAAYNYFHEKAMAIDGKTLVAGSINWSNSALTKNRETDFRIESVTLTREWLSGFEADWQAGFPVTQKTKTATSPYG